MTLRSLSLLVSLALCTPLAAHAIEFTPQELARASALQKTLLTLDSHLDTPANFHRAGFDIQQRHDHNALSQVDYPRMVEGALDGGFWRSTPTRATVAKPRTCTIATRGCCG